MGVNGADKFSEQDIEHEPFETKVEAGTKQWLKIRWMRMRLKGGISVVKTAKR
jgi:hypothetical protein